MSNTIITAALLSWCAAQSAKVLIGFWRYGINDRTRCVWRIIWAGGMPSAHSAVAASWVVIISLSNGIQSPLFGLALVTAVIVIYDRSRMFAIYQTFQNRYPDLKKTVQKDPVLTDLVGHRVSEVVVGLLIGIGTAIIVNACHR